MEFENPSGVAAVQMSGNVTACVRVHAVRETDHAATVSDNVQCRHCAGK